MYHRILLLYILLITIIHCYDYQKEVLKRFYRACIFFIFCIKWEQENIRGQLMRIAICDDDELIIGQLEHYLAEYFFKNKLKQPEVHTYTIGETLLKEAEPFDIIFLDIEMPGQNGIYVGRKLKEKYPKLIIIIITSFAEYLDEAMRFQVFRYLSKPIDKNRLFRNMKDAISMYSCSDKKIILETKEGTTILSASDIILIEAKGREITVCTKDGSHYVSIHNMNYWMETLDMPDFFRTHRSYIVNLGYVSFFDHSLIHLCENKYTAYLTRRKYTDFKAAYLLYAESIR